MIGAEKNSFFDWSSSSSRIVGPFFRFMFIVRLIEVRKKIAWVYGERPSQPGAHVRNLRILVFFAVGCLYCPTTAHARYFSSCEKSVIEKAQKNAKLLFENQQRLPTLARAPTLKKPVSFFAFSDKDFVKEKIKSVVNEIALEAGSNLVGFDGIGQSNLFLIIASNQSQFDSDSLKQQVVDKIYSIMDEKKQSPFRDKITNFVYRSFDLAKAEIKNGAVSHIIRLDINGTMEFSLFFFAGQKDEKTSDVFISDKALSEFVLLNIGIPPITDFENSISSNRGQSFRIDILTASDLAIARILLLSPTPSQWQSGLVALRSMCTTQ